MFSEKTIVVTIGNYGAVVALHDSKEIKNKVFLEELSDEAKKQLAVIFVKNKSAPIYVLLDTIDQSYKKKIYPSVRKSDLSRIIKREMAADSDKEAIKNYIILNAASKSKKSGQVNHRWECLFVSSSNSQTINKWIEFLLDMPGHLVGIYMLPIEAFELFVLLKENLKSKSRVHAKHNDLYCLVVQNKVSGIRQIVLSDQGIVFTRVVNYNFEQEDFLEKYEQDIYSTFEYLKRLFPDLAISELNIVNIFPNEILEQLKKINSVELNFINYTPNQAAADAGYHDLLPQNSSFCDLIISKSFARGKKILKFTTPKIVFLEKFFTALSISYYLNLFCAVAICGAVLLTILSKEKIAELVEISETEKFSALRGLTKIKKIALEGAQLDKGDESVTIEKVTEFGKIEEALGAINTNFIDSYSKLKFLKNFNFKLTRFSYARQGFNEKSPAPSPSYDIGFSGKILNESGDIEDLFKEFDALVLEVKKNLGDKQVSYSDLPRNIDFNKKYYDFPVDFTITVKTQ